MSHNISYLLLGSNMGKREEYLSRAIALINKIGTRDKGQGTRVTAKSSVYNTLAWGNKNQNDFLNQAICIETKLEAEELLKEILSIEKELGRTREKKWEARTIDIDILFFDKQIINSPTLTIPHPHLHERRFALVPLNEIGADFTHPLLGKTVKQLLDECADKLEVSAHL